MRNFLVLLAGGNEQVTGHLPAERRIYAGLGSLMVATSLIAVFSMVHAVNVFLLKEKSAVVSVFVGIAWGLLILAMDSAMVSTMEYGKNRGWSLAIRFTAAALIGLIVSTPITLRIFEADVRAGVKAIQDEQASFGYKSGDDIRERLEGLQDEISTLDKVINATEEEFLREDESVSAVRQSLESVNAKIKEEEFFKTCEERGNSYDEKCGSVGAIPGCGGNCKAREQNLESLRREQAEIKVDLEQRQSAVIAKLPTEKQNALREKCGPGVAAIGSASGEQVAGEECKGGKFGEVERLQQELQELDNSDPIRQNSGLLIQLQALWNRLSSSWLGSIFGGGLLLFFLLLEMLPTGAKWLIVSRRQSQYEAVWRMVSKWEVAHVASTMEMLERRSRRRDELNNAVEADMNERLMTAGKQVNAGLVQEFLSAQARTEVSAPTQQMEEEYLLSFPPPSGEAFPFAPPTNVQPLADSFAVAESETTR
ncbi:DUF4407 domain-containing protein [Buchananella hordeovulneris]|uniref:DUF4407 domain-containing protein n=1 Tax=Buchananella hordeovulneris TaxID=52770 RepID=UPI0026DB370E|nr:DUF4407 domain-containing protein [Buchananella hordeovulneris]MDO5080647.1 DUF4407 domain-containing protein [Buchananella hordeovulneris]